MCPYVSKKKYPLQQCLTILNEALAHVEKRPSAAVQERGMPSRTTKQVLERVLNQMNLKMEQSDYQAAANLLGLPSIIRSDAFIFGNPDADDYYRYLQKKQYTDHSQNSQGPTFLQQLMAQLNSADESTNASTVPNADAPESGATNAETVAEDNTVAALSSFPPIEYEQKSLGHLRVFTFHEKGPSGEDVPSKTIVPCSALYVNRGKELRFLNRNEYRALVGCKHKSADTSRSKVTEYNYGENFVIGSQYTQYPVAKHRTVVLTSKAPPYPGPEVPVGHIEYEQWKTKADRYACYFLIEFRPEEDCYQDGQINTYRYDWDALKDWCHSYETDPYILSKFRLMAMHIRMRGFATRFHDKVMLSEYRSRCRYEWTDEELQQHATENYLERLRERHERNILDETLYSETFNRLSVRSRASVDRQVAHDKAQVEALNALFPETSQQQPQARPVLPRRSRVTTGLYEGMEPEEIMGIARSLRIWKRGVEEGSSQNTESSIPPEVVKHNLRVVEASMKSAEQKWFFNFYSDYLSDPYNEYKRPPDIVLLHGPAGTGKSTVIRGIIKAAHICALETLNTAFNNINALDLAGYTTASLISLNMKTDMHMFSAMTHDKLIQLRRLMRRVKLLIVDEVSTQAPFHLAQLSWAVEQAVGDDSEVNQFNYGEYTETGDRKYFGGIPTILAGDLNQLGPVKAGDSLTAAVMRILQHEFGPVRGTKRRRRR